MDTQHNTSVIDQLESLFYELLKKFEDDERSLDIEYGGSEELTIQEIALYRSTFQRLITPLRALYGIYQITARLGRRPFGKVP